MTKTESVAEHLERAKSLFLEGSEAMQRADLGFAIDRFEQALALAPGHPGIMVALGAALASAARLDDALFFCEAVLDQSLGIAEAWNLLGVINQKAGHPREALACFEKALGLKPSFADAALNLGRTLFKLKLPEHSLDVAESIIGSGEMVIEAMQLKAESLTALGKEDAALAVYEASIARRPTPEALSDRAHLMMKSGRYDEARRDLHRSLAIAPHHHNSLYNMASLLKDTGHFHEALGVCETALSTSPKDPDTRYLHSVILLTLGQLTAGWADFDARFEIPEDPVVRRVVHPDVWDFAPCDRLLVWGEQGIGEEILFSCCLRDARKLTRSMAVIVNPKLKPLFQRTFPDIDVYGYLEADGVQYTHHIAMGDLAAHFRPDVAAFERLGPSVLEADAHRVRSVAAELPARPAGGLRVGLSWYSGNPKYNRFKSVPAADMAPLLALEGIQFVNLQYGEAATALDALPLGSGSSLVRLDSVDAYDDLDGLLALIEACDLVVTVSNTTAHLAAASGKPVILLLTLGSGHFWYWHAGCPELKVPWYGQVRRLLQTTIGEWPPVIADSADAVMNWPRRGS